MGVRRHREGRRVHVRGDILQGKDNTSHLQPVLPWPGLDADSTDEQWPFPRPVPGDSPSHHDHPRVQQCQVQVVDVRVPWVVLGHLSVGEARLAGTLQPQPRHSLCTAHGSGQAHIQTPLPLSIHIGPGESKAVQSPKEVVLWSDTAIQSQFLASAQLVTQASLLTSLKHPLFICKTGMGYSEV